MGSSGTARVPLSEGELLQLRRWNTPTIYNGWEQITQHDASREGFNGDRVCDFMPQMGPMVGYAVTVVCQPSNPCHSREHPTAWRDYRTYVGSVAGPKIVVVQDLDKFQRRQDGVANMTGKERLLATLAGERADRVPFVPNIWQWFHVHRDAGTRTGMDGFRRSRPDRSPCAGPVRFAGRQTPVHVRQRLQFVAANAVGKPPRLPRRGPEIRIALLKFNSKTGNQTPTEEDMRTYRNRPACSMLAVAALVLPVFAGSLAAESPAPRLEKQNLFEARTNGYWTCRIPGIAVTKSDVVLVTTEARPGRGGDYD
jgi:hypothetical protein